MLTVPKLPVPVQARQVSFAAGSYFLHLTECRRRPAGSDEELAKTHPDHSSLSVQAPDRNALAHAAAGARSMVARRGPAAAYTLPGSGSDDPLDGGSGPDGM